MDADRMRAAWWRLRRRSFDDTRDELGEPWARDLGTVKPAPPTPIDPGEVTTAASPRPAPPAPPVRAADAGLIDAGLIDAGLVQTLGRVAEAFERLAESLDADRRDRRGTVDDVHSLLRELVVGLTSPTAVSPVVVAGTIESTPGPVRPPAPLQPPAPPRPPVASQPPTASQRPVPPRPPAPPRPPTPVIDLSEVELPVDVTPSRTWS